MFVTDFLVLGALWKEDEPDELFSTVSKLAEKSCSVHREREILIQTRATEAYSLLKVID